MALFGKAPFVHVDCCLFRTKGAEIAWTYRNTASANTSAISFT